jgi:hypothetical protein
MIDTLFFLLQVIGIAVLLGWAVIHDRLADGARSSGPLAFKQTDIGKAADSQGRVRSRGLTSHRRRANLRP